MAGNGPAGVRRAGFFQNVQQRFGAEEAAAFGLGGGGDNALGLQLADGPHHGVVRQIQFLFCAAGSEEGIGAQHVNHLERGARVRPAS